METGLCDRNGNAGSIPLKEVFITGGIIGAFADITIRQVYINETDNNIEAVYTFPVTDTASVYGFKAILGDNQVAGEIMEKDEAFKRYDDAVTAGDSAFLMEQFRPNIFHVSIGQVKPDEKVEIEFSYIDELKEADNEIRLTIPTVTAPRYIPGSPAGPRRGTGTASPTDRVPDADFISPPLSGRADYTVKVHLDVNPLRKVISCESPSHNIRVGSGGIENTVISLAQQDVKLDRDFILILKLRPEASSFALAGRNDKGEGFIYTAFVPEIPPPAVDEGREYLFLLDISGSMEGNKLDQAKNALKICMRNLSENDRFNIVAFETGCHYFSRSVVSYDEGSLKKAVKWIDSLYAMGGTEILEAVKYSLAGETGERTVLLFTDGQVGNEDEIIKYVSRNKRDIRIFTFGIDTAVNTWFLNRLAEVAYGKSEFVYPGERIDDKVVRQFSRIVSPAVRDVAVDWGGTKTHGVTPGEIGSIFDMEFVTVLAKYDGNISGNVKLSGKSDGRDLYWDTNVVKMPEREGSMLARIWAKNRMQALEAGLGGGNPRRTETLKKEIIHLSKEYGIISGFTSFVAVSERKDKATGLPVTVVVPVMLPSEWKEPAHMMAGTYFRSHPASRSMRLNNAVPAVSSINEASDAYDLKMPTFLRHQRGSMLSSQKKSECVKKQSGKLFEDIELNVGEMLRILARNQHANGAFADTNEKRPEHAAASTANVLTAFAFAGCDISMYRRQLEKGIEYLCGYLADTSSKTDDMAVRKACFRVMLAAKACLLRNVFRPAANKASERLLGITVKNMTLAGAMTEQYRKVADCGELKTLIEMDDIVKAIADVEDVNEEKLKSQIAGFKDEGLVVNLIARLCILCEIKV